MEGPFVMAVDVGITNVKSALVDKRGRFAYFATRPISMHDGANGVAAVLVETCREVLKQSNTSTRDLIAVGCSVPGCVNPDDGVIVASGTPGWEGTDIRTPLESSFERKVTVEGDGAATTLSLYTFGPSAGQDYLVGISIGTAISCGFIKDGKLVYGFGQAAMEAGHMPLFYEGRQCSCGLSGCWEAHAGGGALRSLLKEFQQAGYQLPDLPEQLAEMARNQDEMACKIWQEQGTILGLGIAILLNVLNPKTVALAGGLTKSWSLFKKSLLKTARERSSTRNSTAAIVCANDPDRTALLGAAAAAIRAQGPQDFFVDANKKAT